MKATYKILQLDENQTYGFVKMFLSWKELTSMYKFDFNDYETVYCDEIEGDNEFSILEELYTIFNVRHPIDFKGHSLSVSDVIVLNDDVYYCDDIGWKKVC